MSKLDYYEVLMVKRNANDGEIKAAYRKLAMKYHPDRNSGNKDAEQKFKECKEAYEVLKDPEKRSLYDRFGHEGLQGGQGGGGQGGFGDIFNDIFGDIFGGGRRGGGGAQVYRGDDLAYRLKITLEESAFGANREISFPRQATCSTCSGSGAAPGHTPTTCSQCGGAGQVRMQQGFFSVAQTCPVCRGTGKEITHPCPDCNGQGMVQENRTLSVKIPAGVDTGDRIRLQGEGAAGENGGPSGDLYIQLEVEAHHLFERQGQDLACEVPISFATATLGGMIEVPTLQEAEEIEIKPETQTGSVYRLRGRGITSARTGKEGDLFCTVKVETPVNLSPKQKELLREFGASLDEKRERHSPNHSSWTDKVRSFFDNLKQ
jgi:molecular chaperone DnaJ